MSFWVVFLAAVLMTGVILAAVLLGVASSAILNGRPRESVITVASLQQALQSIYDATLRESVPADFRALLRKLPSHGTPKVRRQRTARAAVN